MPDSISWVRISIQLLYLALNSSTHMSFHIYLGLIALQFSFHCQKRWSFWWFFWLSSKCYRCRNSPQIQLFLKKSSLDITVYLLWFLVLLLSPPPPPGFPPQGFADLFIYLCNNIQQLKVLHAHYISSAHLIRLKIQQPSPSQLSEEVQHLWIPLDIIEYP